MKSLIHDALSGLQKKTVYFFATALLLITNADFVLTLQPFNV